MKIVFIILCGVVVLTVSWIWATGIEDMNNNHHDYKGKDFLGEDTPKKWDDNKQHTEDFN